MEVLIVCLLATWVVKTMATDTIHAMRGELPARDQARLARMQARQEAGGGRGWLAEALIAGRERQARKAAKKAAKGEPGPARQFAGRRYREAWDAAEKKWQDHRDQPKPRHRAGRRVPHALCGDCGAFPPEIEGRCLPCHDKQREGRPSPLPPPPGVPVCPGCGGGMALEINGRCGGCAPMTEIDAEIDRLNRELGKAPEPRRTPDGDLYFGTDPTDPNGVKECGHCLGAGVVDGDLCERCRDRQEQRNADAEAARQADEAWEAAERRRQERRNADADSGPTSSVVHQCDSTYCTGCAECKDLAGRWGCSCGEHSSRRFATEADARADHARHMSRDHVARDAQSDGPSNRADPGGVREEDEGPAAWKERPQVDPSPNGMNGGNPSNGSTPTPGGTPVSETVTVGRTKAFAEAHKVHSGKVQVEIEQAAATLSGKGMSGPVLNALNRTRELQAQLTAAWGDVIKAHASHEALGEKAKATSGAANDMGYYKGD